MVGYQPNATFRLTPEIAEAYLELLDYESEERERLVEEFPEEVRAHLKRLLETETKAPWPWLDEPTAVPSPRFRCAEIDVENVELLAEIGRGGMGVVYLGRRRELSQWVAVKYLHPAFQWHASARKRFAREARAIARLDHPNIVKIFGIGSDPESGTPCIVMEYLRARSLAELVALTATSDSPPSGRALHRLLSAEDTADEETTPPFFRGTWRDVCTRITLGAAEALGHAHAQGVAHRDVKPSNIMLTREGRIVLIDFGIAHDRVETSLTHSNDLAGSLPYLAPERLQGGSSGHGPTSSVLQDVYGLGLTYFELLNTRPAFQATTLSELVDQVRAGIGWREFRVPADVRTVCQRAMDPDPARRYRDMGALIEDLSRLLEGRTPLARPLGPWLRAWRFAVQHRALVATSLAVATIVTTVIIAVVTDTLRREANRREATLRVEALVDRADERANRSEWQAASEAIRSARSVTAMEHLDGAVRRRVAATLAHVEDGQRRDQRDREMRESLRTIQLRLSLGSDYLRATRELEEALRAYGLVLSREGIDAAIQALEASTIREDLYQAFDALLGLSLGAHAERNTPALPWLSLATSLAPFDPDAERARSRIAFLRSPESETAKIQELETWASVPPNNLVLASRHLEAQGELDRAIALLERGRRYYPSDFVLLTTLAHYLSMPAQLPNSREHLLDVRQDLRAAFPDSPAVLSNLIAQHADLAAHPDLEPEERRKCAMAMEELSDLLLSAEPRHEFTLHNRALTRLRLGNASGALEDHAVLLELRSRGTWDWACTLHDQGLALANLGRFREALSSFESAVGAFPTNERFLQSVGKCRLILDDRAGAAEAYERIPPDWPEYPTIQRALFSIWKYLKSPEEIVERGKALEEAPFFEEAMPLSLRILVATSALELALRTRAGDEARGREALDLALRWLEEEGEELERALGGPMAEPHPELLRYWGADSFLGRLPELQDASWPTPDQKARCDSLRVLHRKVIDALKG